jgi:hypothetical protein
MSIGVGLLLVSMAVPILVYAVWAASPGRHPAPVEWSNTRPALRLWLLAPLIYLGAFASGIRPARWSGSRLLPLIALVIPALLVYNLPPLAGIPALGLLSGAYVSNILLDAEARDF